MCTGGRGVGGFGGEGGGQCRERARRIPGGEAAWTRILALRYRKRLQGSQMPDCEALACGYPSRLPEQARAADAHGGEERT